MSFFVWSQILAGIGMLLSIGVVQIRNAKTMRIVMFISSLFRGAHFFLLGTPQAGWITGITGIRWFTSIFTHRKSVKIIFIILIIGVGIINLEQSIGVLPIIAGILGTLAAFTTQDRMMRVYLVIAMILWVIHNIVIGTPVGILSSTVFLVSNIIGYKRFYHHKHVCLFNC